MTPMLWFGFPGIFNSKIFPYWVSRNLSFRSGFPWFLWRCMLESLCSSKLGVPVLACLSWGQCLPWVLISSVNLTRAHNFSVCSVYTCCWDKLATSKLLTCGTGNWKSFSLSFHCLQYLYQSLVSLLYWKLMSFFFFLMITLEICINFIDLFKEVSSHFITTLLFSISLISMLIFTILFLLLLWV